MLIPFDVHHNYTEKFSLILFLGSVSIPVFNAILATPILTLIYIYIPIFNYTYIYQIKIKLIYRLPLIIILISLLSLLWNIGLLWDTEAAVIPTFLVYSIFRTTLYCFIFPYIHDTFGAE